MVPAGAGLAVPAGEGSGLEKSKTPIYFIENKANVFIENYSNLLYKYSNKKL